MTTNFLAERPSLKLARHYPVAPEKVWRAWTDPSSLKRWFFPAPQLEVVLAEADLRVGGAYRILLRAPGGEEHGAGGVYRELVPQRKLVFTWTGNCGPEAESLVTVTLAPAGQGTDLTLLHERFADQVACDRHEAGWNACLAGLEDFFAGA